MSRDRRRARLVLIGTALIFLVPVLGAWILNVAAPQWRPFGQVNHGVLLRPPPRVPDAPLRDAEGRSVEPPHLVGKWTLLYLREDSCAAACEQALDTMRRARLALAREAPRVRRLLLARAPGAPYRPATPFDDLDVAVATEPWLSILEAAKPEAGTAAGNIYVVDPQGYLIMRHPGATPVRHLHEDLDRLLDVSMIGMAPDPTAAPPSTVLAAAPGSHPPFSYRARGRPPSGPLARTGATTAGASPARLPAPPLGTPRILAPHPSPFGQE